MIKINLLPFRAARKRENIKRQITFYLAVVALTLVLIVVTFTRVTSKASDLKAQENQVKTELAAFKKELDEIKDLEKRIKEIKTKLNVIKDLEKGKTGPVLLLADVADAVPRNMLWLTSYKESKGTLTLTGTAMDNETVALFMNNLEDGEQIGTVDLESAKLRDIPQYGLKVSDFVLKCTLSSGGS